MKKKQSIPPKGRTAPPTWARALERRMQPYVRAGVPSPARQLKLLREGIAELAKRPVDSAARGRRSGAPDRALALMEQPFDGHLLELSPLYRRSRELYLEGGGQFHPALVSSPRTLGSPILLEQRIEYSPIERELIWAATDPGQARDADHLLKLRTFTSSLFHEQSHRILWTRLPPPAAGASALRRYLNFVESLVITLDMALGDELGPALSAVFYMSGVLYDPGTSVRAGLSRREYRNYLQAALHATYLNLELFEPREIPDAVAALFGALPEEHLARATARSLNLDRGFVTRTNPVWQERHRAAVVRALGRLQGKRWAPPEDPLDNREQYLFAESWFELLGL